MDPVEYLEELVQIESHENVEEIQQYLLETVDDSILHETGCVYAEKYGSKDGPQIVLNTHMDVVSPHVDFERDDGIIRGRGACDAKGSLAPMVVAFSQIEPSHGSVQLIISPDEETTQRGLYEYLSESISGDFAIVGEPSGLDICHAARGHYDLLVELHGESAHGATPESGTNATTCSAEAISRITELPHREDETLGTNNFTPTIIEGGNRPNQVPAYAKFVIDYRTVPGEDREDAVQRIRDALEGLSCEYEISFYSKGSSLDSFKTSPSNKFVVAFEEAVGKITNKDTTIRPFDAATEAAFFAPHMPVVVFGPGLISDGEHAIAHSENEYVKTKEVSAATKTLQHFLSEQLTP